MQEQNHEQEQEQEQEQEKEQEQKQELLLPPQDSDSPHMFERLGRWNLQVRPESEMGPKLGELARSGCDL